MKRFLVAPSALDDLAKIEREGAERFGEEQATGFMERLWATFETLAEQHGLGLLITELPIRGVRFFAVGPYLVVYRWEESPIEIVRVVDGRSDLEERLKQRGCPSQKSIRAPKRQNRRGAKARARGHTVTAFFDPWCNRRAGVHAAWRHSSRW